MQRQKEFTCIYCGKQFNILAPHKCKDIFRRKHLRFVKTTEYKRYRKDIYRNL